MSTRPSALRPFHDVGSIFPDDVTVVTVDPSSTVGEALKLMLEKRYSQVPVMANGKVRGVFSLWSLAQHLADFPRVEVHGLAVEDVMETLPQVTVDDPLDVVLEQLVRHEAVLVASPRGLQAIATATDILAYFYRIARPFVLLQEIEGAVRELIQLCIAPDALSQAIETCLKQKYEAKRDRPPHDLYEMTFDDYRTIICSRDHWPTFEGVLGRSRELVSGKLDRVRDIRNSVFHFREDVSVSDHQTLAATRQWLLDKTRSLLEKRRTAENG
jgi:CBS domain-containing protein